MQITIEHTLSTTQTTFVAVFFRCG